MKVNHQTEKVLSKQYADIIVGDDDREELVRDALGHLEVVEKELPLVLDVFDQLATFVYEQIENG